MVRSWGRTLFLTVLEININFLLFLFTYLICPPGPQPATFSLKEVLPIHHRTKGNGFISHLPYSYTSQKYFLRRVLVIPLHLIQLHLVY